MLPRIAASEITQASLLVDRRVRLGVLAMAAAALIGVAVAAVVLDIVCGTRFPELGRLFAVYVGLYILVATLGPFNMEIHRLGAASTEALVNGIRLAMLAVVIAIYGDSLAAIVTASILVILVGEIVMFAVSRRLARQA